MEKLGRVIASGRGDISLLNHADDIHASEVARVRPAAAIVRPLCRPVPLYV